MDNLTYHGGLLLKRKMESSGRTPTIEQVLVAAWLMAQEQEIDLERLVHILIQASDYDAIASKLDRDARIRQLMGF